MPRSRIINPEFFLHEGLGRCTPHARLLFIALWTQADREGRVRWLPLRIHGEAFPHEPRLDISALAAELVEAGTFILYEHEGRVYGEVTGFTKWQNPHRNESASKLPPPPDEPDFDVTFSTLGQPKENLRSTQGQSMDRPILVTSYQLPATSSELPVTSRTSSKDEVCPTRSRPDSGAAPPPVEFEDPVLRYLASQWGPLLGKHESLPKWIQTARDAYPGVDLLSEAKKAAAWEMANPANKKKQIRAFLTRWWGRAQDRGAPGQRAVGSSKTEDAIALALKLGATQ
tara:strand:- start:1132 stop:1989 length:858 start_codon:yes stop_codon:yes gene_type:complete